MRVIAFETRVYLVEYQADTEDESEAIELVATGEADEVGARLYMVKSRDNITPEEEL